MNSISKKQVNDLDDLMKPQIEKAFDRWQDEMKYENFDEYKKFLKSCFIDAVATTGYDAQFDKVVKKRKGNLIEVHFNYDSWHIVMCCTRTQYQWKGYSNE
jgi:hypothetical protein